MTTDDLLAVIRSLHTALMQADATLDIVFPGEDADAISLRQEALIAGVAALPGNVTSLDDTPIRRGIARGMATVGVQL